MDHPFFVDFIYR